PPTANPILKIRNNYFIFNFVLNKITDPIILTKFFYENIINKRIKYENRKIYTSQQIFRNPEKHFEK
ncbi:hypothetical protein DF186_22600, partial [Enterococcus hirae]